MGHGRGSPTTCSCCEGGRATPRTLWPRGRCSPLRESVRSSTVRFHAGLDSFVRLAGALSVTLDDHLAGVSWTPAVLESEVKGGYSVGFETEGAGDQT